MKKYVLIALIVTATSTIECAIGTEGSFGFCRERKDVGFSFMFTRPINGHLSTEQSLWHNLMYKKHGPHNAAAQIIFMQQESIDSAKPTKYFFFDEQLSLSVIGDDIGVCNQRARDIRAEWVGLPANFSGHMSIAPHQRQFMLSISISQDIKTYSSHPVFENMWVEFVLPVVSVENQINLTQNNIVNPSSTFPHDIIDAFNQPSWQYSKIGPSSSVIRLAEIRFLLGRTYLSENNNEVDYYSIISLPTANNNNQEHLFDAVAGYNRHCGFGAGINFQFVLNRDMSKYSSCWFLTVESIFFARNMETRTLGLVNKPWSRYMLYVRDDRPADQTPTPGVNVLSKKVHVHSYNTFDFVTGWRMKTRRMEFEIGYNIWGHGKERLDPHCEHFCNFQFGIAGTPGPDSTCAVTASRSTIDVLAPNDVDCAGNPVFVALQPCDIDLNSGAAQCTFNDKVHVSFGLINEGKYRDAFLGVGFFYDQPHGHKALKLIGGWVKCGSTF